MNRGLSVTKHAVERYVDRYGLTVSFREAQDELRQIASEARPMRRKSLGSRSTDVWTSRGVRLVVQEGWIVVTVLGPEEAGDGFDGLPEDVAEELQQRLKACETKEETPGKAKVETLNKRLVKQSLARTGWGEIYGCATNEGFAKCGCGCLGEGVEVGGGRSEKIGKEEEGG